MSSVIVIQTYESLWIGADSAVSVRLGDKTYRWHEDGQKLFVVDESVIFCSGSMNLAQQVMDDYRESKDFSLQNLQRIASTRHSEYVRLNPAEYVEGENLCLGIMVNKFENGRTVVYSINPYDNFEIVERVLTDNTQFAIWAGGIRVNEASTAAITRFRETFNVVSALQYAFDHISYEAVGGNLTVYEVTAAGVRKHMVAPIAEKSGIKRLSDSILAEQHAHLVVAETIIGQLGNFVTMEIGTGNNVTKINTNGISAGHANFASAPFRLDMAGNLTANSLTANSASIANSTFTNGTIVGSSINVGSGKFTVDSAGNLFTLGGVMSGGIITGSTVQTAGTTRRIVLEPDGLRSYDNSGVKRISIDTTDAYGYQELRFYGQSGAKTGTISGTDGQLNVAAQGSNALVLGGQRVVIGGEVQSVDFQGVPVTGLNGKATTGASTSTQTSINGGIAPGTQLALFGGGYVTWLGVPAHSHTQN
ncbi:MAG: hypothetical protein K6T85_12575 [Gorillibacterium sp.]|nr:hypothetical protein [Gorillibacterium sp.]